MARIPSIRNPMPMPSRDIFLDLEAPAKLQLGNLSNDGFGLDDFQLPMFPGQVGLLPNRRVCGVQWNAATAAEGLLAPVTSGSNVGWNTAASRRISEYAFGIHSAGNTINQVTSVNQLFTTGGSSKRLVVLFTFPDRWGTIPTTGDLTNLRFFAGWASTTTIGNVFSTHDPAAGTRVVGIQFDTINDPTETDFFIVRDDDTTFSRTNTNVGVEQAISDTTTPEPFWYLLEMVQSSATGPVNVYMQHSAKVGTAGLLKQLVGTVDWFESPLGVAPIAATIMVGIRNEAGAGTSRAVGVAWMFHDEFGNYGAGESAAGMGAPPFPMADTFVPTIDKPRRANPVGSVSS